MPYQRSIGLYLRSKTRREEVENKVGNLFGLPFYYENSD